MQKEKTDFLDAEGRHERIHRARSCDFHGSSAGTSTPSLRPPNPPWISKQNKAAGEPKPPAAAIPALPLLLPIWPKSKKRHISVPSLPGVSTVTVCPACRAGFGVNGKTRGLKVHHCRCQSPPSSQVSDPHRPGAAGPEWGSEKSPLEHPHASRAGLSAGQWGRSKARLAESSGLQSPRESWSMVWRELPAHNTESVLFWRLRAPF